MKRKWIGILTACLAIVLVIWAGRTMFAGRSRFMVAQAARPTLYGIEQLKQNFQTQTKAYTILEVVPSVEAAEIGYLFAGFEPCLSTRVDSGEWVGWRETLQTLPTPALRADYMHNLEIQYRTFLDRYGLTAQNAPIVYETYQESEQSQSGYVSLSLADSHKTGYFSGIDTASAQEDRYEISFYHDGTTVEMFLTKSEDTQYYLVQTTSAYHALDRLEDDTMLLVYDPLKKSYEAVMTWAAYRQTVDEERSAVSAGDLLTEQTGEEDALQPYREAMEKEAAGGTYYVFDVMYEPILDRQVQNLDPDTPLYVVDEQSICKEETGAYQFVPTAGGHSYPFSKNETYYTGGFVNREWFRDKVLDMDEQEWEQFPVRIFTMTVGELNALWQQEEGILPFDLLYINSGYAATGSVGYDQAHDLVEAVREQLWEKVQKDETACIVDASLLYQKEGDSLHYRQALQDTQIFALCSSFLQETDAYAQDELQDADGNYVKENRYSFFAPDRSLICADFDQPVFGSESDLSTGFETVLEEILTENEYRRSDRTEEEQQNYELLDTGISQATVIRHIVNYRYRRSVWSKAALQVLDIEPAYAREEAFYLTASEVRAWIGGALSEDDITIHRMTTAEFIGKIEDINAQYDLIYIGTDTDRLNTDPDTGETVFNDASMDGLIYFHTGDLRYVSLVASGLLDTEYPSPEAQAKGMPYFFNPIRYGGNDITKEKQRALEAFLDGSYPIVVSDDLFYTQDHAATIFSDIGYRGKRIYLKEGTYTKEYIKEKNMSICPLSLKVREGFCVVFLDDTDHEIARLTEDTYLINLTEEQKNTVSQLKVERTSPVAYERTIDTDHLDNSSYLYDFVLGAKDRDNFFVREDVAMGQSAKFQFYVNRSKVTLEDLQVAGEKKDTIYCLRQDHNGKYQLNYQFKIQNQGAATLTTPYQCHLYVDVNADGKYSDTEELQDITISADGQALDAEQPLFAEQTYTITRVVPDGYKGVLPWKLEIVQANNPNIRGCAMGYAKLMDQAVEVIKVLQISRKPVDSKGNVKENEYLNLAACIEDETNIYHQLIYGNSEYEGIRDDFDIQVDFLFAEEFNKEYKKAEAEHVDYLANYNMIIFGFSDMYDDIEGDEYSGPMKGIIAFINSGKSVLFAHDTIGSFDFDVEKNIANSRSGEGKQFAGYVDREGEQERTLPTWWKARAINMTKYLRNLAGMDRYGIAALDAEPVAAAAKAYLQKGEVIYFHTSAWEALHATGKDIAYAPKTGKTQVDPLVQGFTYTYINGWDKETADQWGEKGEEYNIYRAEEVRTDDDVAIRYRNLDFGKVFYTDDDESYDNGEMIQRDQINPNGQIEQLMVTKTNSGQITDYPYHLEDTFEVPSTHSQYCQLDFTADDDDDGQSDLVVWYCLGGRNAQGEKKETIYSASPNDVSNNYYIYNKGNITYTGVGHSGNRASVGEAKLFINTIIAAYHAGIKDPGITLQNSASPSATESIASYSYYDQENNLTLGDIQSDGVYPIYFIPHDVNFVKGERTMVVNLYCEDAQGDTIITVNGSEKKVTKMVPGTSYQTTVVRDGTPGTVTKNLSADHGQVREAASGAIVASDQLKSGAIYAYDLDKQFLRDKISENGSQCRFYFEVQSFIRKKGINDTWMEQKTAKIYAPYDFTVVTLFELK